MCGCHRANAGSEMKPEVTDQESQEIHGDARKAQLLRTAKIVCETGEYLCLIRELSQIGLSLKFLHEAPSDHRVILQLTNGLTYPIERVWTGRQQAGYRFVTEIDPAEFLCEEAPHVVRPIRLSLSAPAIITDGRLVTNVILKDLSREGAQFESEAAHPVDTLVSFEVFGLPQRLGEIRWHNGDLYGMRFQHPLTLQQLADAALDLQPLVVAPANPVIDALRKSYAA